MADVFSLKEGMFSTKGEEFLQEICKHYVDPDHLVTDPVSLLGRDC